jgi:hypothetical protein
MKVSVLFLFGVMIFAVSCKKAPEKFGFIIAGDKNGDGIHYGDIKDTGIYSSGRTNLDIDLDGEIDIFFGQTGYYTRLTSSTSFRAGANDNAALGVDRENSYILALDAGQRIDGTYLWDANYNVLFTSGINGGQNPPEWTEGHWAGAVDKYMPFKLVKGERTYYGWVRLDMQNIRIKDYAYRE